MYGEFERPSGRRMIVTVLAVVVAVAVAFAASIAVATLLSTPSRATVAKTPATAKPRPKHKRHIAKATAHATAAVAQTQPKPVASPAPAKKAKPKAKPKPATKVAVASSSAVVVIDAGHQAHGDSSLEPIGPGSGQKKAKVAGGASGPYAPHAESEINLAVALKLEKLLKARGVRVIMVRTRQNVNISNSARAAIANKAHATLFVRIHCDGIGNSSVHGISMQLPGSNKWTRPILSRSVKAGKIVDKAVLAATGATNRGLVQRSDLSGFNWSKVPTILIEMGFMSNRAEDRKLTTPSYQQKMAVGLANGVVSYLHSR